MTVRMVEEVRCDHCGKTEQIVLASHDDKYHLCAVRAGQLLQKLTHAPVSLTLEEDQTVTCIFCGRTWGAKETGPFVAPVKEVETVEIYDTIRICDTCIIEAAREAIRQRFISVKIHYDC